MLSAVRVSDLVSILAEDAGTVLVEGVSQRVRQGCGFAMAWLAVEEGPSQGRGGC